MYETIYLHQYGAEKVPYLLRSAGSNHGLTTQGPTEIKTGVEKMNQPKPANKPQTPATFEVACAVLYAKGRSRAAAIREAAQNYPELHNQYLKRLTAGGNDHLRTLFEVVENSKAGLLTGTNDKKRRR